MPNGKLITFNNTLYTNTLKPVLDDTTQVVDKYYATSTFKLTNTPTLIHTFDRTITNALFYIRFTTPHNNTYSTMGLSAEGTQDSSVFQFKYPLSYMSYGDVPSTIILRYYMVNGVRMASAISCFGTSQSPIHILPIANNDNNNKMYASNGNQETWSFYIDGYIFA